LTTEASPRRSHSCSTLSLGVLLQCGEDDFIAEA
jgi:hypothetical protein